MARRTPSHSHKHDDISLHTIKASVAKIQASLAAAADLIPAPILEASGLRDDLTHCRSLGLNHLGLSALQEIGRFAGACGDEESVPKAFWGHLADAAQAMAFDAFLPYLRGKEAGNLGTTWSEVKPAIAALLKALPAPLRKKHAATVAQLQAYLKTDLPADGGPDPAFKALWDDLFALVTDDALPPPVAEIAWPILDCNTFGIRLGDGEGVLSSAEVWWRGGIEAPPAEAATAPAEKPARKATTKKPARAQANAPAKKPAKKPVAKPAKPASKKAASPTAVKKPVKKPAKKPAKKAPAAATKKGAAKPKSSRAR